MDDWKLKAQVKVEIEKESNMYVSSYFRQWLQVGNSTSGSSDKKLLFVMRKRKNSPLPIYDVNSKLTQQMAAPQQQP